MTELSELAPCPLCGMHLQPAADPSMTGMLEHPPHIHCPISACCFLDRADLRAAWNRRAAVPINEAVTVKGLTWEERTSPREDGAAGPTGEWDGMGILGAGYYVYVLDDRYEVLRDDGEHVGSHFLSASQAKAAAQADYTARILSALSPAPPPSEAEALHYAQMLAGVLHAKHYSDVTGWRPLPDLLGLLTQIDNMTAPLVHAAPQAGNSGNGWQDISTAPVACHMQVTYFDHDWGEWVVGIHMKPFGIEPWTHWRPLPAPPAYRLPEGSGE